MFRRPCNQVLWKNVLCQQLPVCDRGILKKRIEQQMLGIKAM
jgi:hypothetical protein